MTPPSLTRLDQRMETLEQDLKDVKDSLRYLGRMLLGATISAVFTIIVALVLATR